MSATTQYTLHSRRVFRGRHGKNSCKMYYMQGHSSSI